MTPQQRETYRQLRIRSFAFTWTAYASYYLCRKNFSVAKSTVAEEQGLSNAQLGDIDTGYLVAYAIGQFVSGALGDRFGGKRLVGAGLIVTALLNMLFGVGQGFLFFLVAWSLNGFAQSSGWPGTTKAFSDWFDQRERGTMMGIWCTCYQVGGVVATFLATWLLVNFGWQSAMFGPALLVLGFALLFLSLQPRSPEAQGLPRVETYYDQISGEVEDSGEEAEISPEEEGDAWESVRLVLKNRVVWTLGLCYVVMKFTRYTFLFWLPFYMANQLGYAKGEAGYTSTVYDIAGVAGAIFAGVVSDRVFQSRRAPIVVIMMVLLAAATFAYGPLSTMGRIPNIIGIALMGFLIFGPDSVTSGVAAVDSGGHKAAGLAAGVVNGLGSIGGAASGLIVGRVSDAYGWDAVFTLIWPMCLLSAALMATLWNAGRPAES